jgi:hypothetical protein
MSPRKKDELLGHKTKLLLEMVEFLRCKWCIRRYKKITVAGEYCVKSQNATISGL